MSPAQKTMISEVPCIIIRIINYFLIFRAKLDVMLITSLTIADMGELDYSVKVFKLREWEPLAWWSNPSHQWPKLVYPLWTDKSMTSPVVSPREPLPISMILSYLAQYEAVYFVPVQKDHPLAEDGRVGF